MWAHVSSAPSLLNPEIMHAIEKASNEFWPGIPIIPAMRTGATDGSFPHNAGIPTCGHTGRSGDIDDNRQHGGDECLLVISFFDGQEHLYRLVKVLSSGK